MHEGCTLSSGHTGGVARVQDFEEQPGWRAGGCWVCSLPGLQGAAGTCLSLSALLQISVQEDRAGALEQAGLRWVTAVCGTASGEGAGEGEYVWVQPEGLCVCL